VTSATSERYVLPRFGHLELGQIDHMEVRAWVAELSASGLAPATTTKAAQLLGKIMKAAVQAGLLPKSPCDGVRLPRIEQTEMRFLDPTEVRALADAIDPRYQATVLLAAYGGLRAGELFGLRAKRVDPLRRTVTIAETLVDVGGHPYFGPPKTRAGHRTIPLPRVAADPLAEHLAAYGRKPDDLVFTAPEGGPVQLNVWRRRFWAPAVRGRSGTPASARPPAHRRGVVDRRRRQPQGGGGPGRTHVGQLHARPLRPPLPGLRATVERRPRSARKGRTTGPTTARTTGQGTRSGDCRRTENEPTSQRARKRAKTQFRSRT
jgi:integrase